MTKNDRHPLVILCLIVLVSMIGLVGKNVYTHLQNAANQNKINQTDADNSLYIEETAEVAAGDDSTIETTTPEEITNIEETTNGSNATTNNENSSNVVTQTNSTKEEASNQDSTTNQTTSQNTSCNTYAALTQYNESLLTAINAARNAAGLNSVYIDSRLTQDAYVRACEEATQHEINHQRLDNSECFSVDKGYYTAEILYRGNVTDAITIVNAWLNSTKHHDVIMDTNSSHTALGIAFIQGDDGLYYCCIGWK